MPLIIQLKSLGEIWGSKLSIISQLPGGSLHSTVKLAPAVKLIGVMMVGGGGGSRGSEIYMYTYLQYVHTVRAVTNYHNCANKTQDPI